MSRGTLAHALLLPVLLVDSFDFFGKTAKAIVELA